MKQTVWGHYRSVLLCWQNFGNRQASGKQKREGKTEKLINLQKTLFWVVTNQWFWTWETSKCQCFQSGIESLGHITSKEGIVPQSVKIIAVTDMSQPSNKMELRKFLGMINYNDRFSPGLSLKCAVLNDLLQNNVEWQWSIKHSETVQEIKTLTSDEMLAKKYWPGKKNKPYYFSPIPSKFKRGSMRRGSLLAFKSHIEKVNSTHSDFTISDKRNSLWAIEQKRARTLLRVDLLHPNTYIDIFFPSNDISTSRLHEKRN